MQQCRKHLQRQVNPFDVAGLAAEKEELEKKKEEEKASSGDLQKAMDKLQELQEELERLKKNSKE